MSMSLGILSVKLAVAPAVVALGLVAHAPGCSSHVHHRHCTSSATQRELSPAEQEEVATGGLALVAIALAAI